MAFLKKAISMIVLGLLVAALTPTSALAKAGGTELPFKGSDTGQISLNLATLEFEAERTGHATHFGRYTVYLEGHIVWITPGVEAEIFATITFVTANGDELFAAGTGIAREFSPEGHTSSGIGFVTGGTGRFADATGEVTDIDHDIQLSNVGGFLVSASKSNYKGWVSLNH